MTSQLGSKGSPVAASASGSRPSSGTSVQEFSIRVPKASKKKFQVMRFNANLSIDFNEWKTNGTQIRMERENNLREFKGTTEEEIPKFGAGSEFGKEAREEARRKKFGIVAKKYKPDDQPWILKIGGKTGKKFKGIREGGVSDNTAYYVFTQAGKGVIEAYPLQEWYKFQPIQRYKALSAEEAEEEFGRRNKIINYFSVMVKKRLRNEDDGEVEDVEEGVKAKGKGSKKKDKSELKISEMDDWVDSDDDASNSDSDGGEKKKKDDEDGDNGKGANKKGKGKGKGKAAAKKKKKKDSDDEAFEESDDGDEEGRELDYISDSSDSASDNEMKANKELKGVAEEDALRKLLNSESEDEEDEEEKKKKQQNESNSDDDEKKKDEKDKGDKSKEEGGAKKKKKKDTKGKKAKTEKKAANGKATDSSSELSPNSSESDSDAAHDKPPKPSKTKDPANSAGSSRSTTPTSVAGEKRKLSAAETAVAAAKKAKLDQGGGPSSTYLPPSSETGVTEDAVRRYLMRKPMTTKELVQKFKTKKTNLTSDQLVNLMTQILKNINPVKQVIKNQLYLSLKPT